jgi:hypothetical protein
MCPLAMPDRAEMARSAWNLHMIRRALFASAVSLARGIGLNPVVQRLRAEAQ